MEYTEFALELIFGAWLNKHCESCNKQQAKKKTCAIVMELIFFSFWKVPTLYSFSPKPKPVSPKQSDF